MVDGGKPPWRDPALHQSGGRPTAMPSSACGAAISWVWGRRDFRRWEMAASGSWHPDDESSWMRWPQMVPEDRKTGGQNRGKSRFFGLRCVCCRAKCPESSRRYMRGAGRGCFAGAAPSHRVSHLGKPNSPRHLGVHREATGGKLVRVGRHLTLEVPRVVLEG